MSPRLRGHNPQPSRPGQWLELSTNAEAEAVDAVAEVFQRWGQGVAVEEPVVSSLDGETVYVDLDRPIVVKTYLPVDEQTEERRQQLEQAVWHLGRLRRVDPLQVQVMSEQDWADAWKRHFFVQHVGQRTVIVPSWRRHRVRPGEVVIRLDPGMAFGTGLHPTTRLCLAALERWLEPGAHVLDLGTGSGILSVAAARLGASSVCALDVDPVAVRVAAENAARNRIRSRVKLHLGSLPLADPPPCPTPFDLAVANITLKVILEVLGKLRQVVRPGGIVILSGVLEDASDHLTAELAGHDFHRLDQQQEGDWIALVARAMSHEP